MKQTTTVTFTVRKTGTTPVTPVEPSQPSGEDGKCDGGAACPIAKFTDVDRNAWYHEYLDYVVTNGLMNGTSASTFAPNATTTRAMVVSILYRLAGSPAVSGANPFADVAAGSWCENAVIWGYENGIVKGFDESTFAPDATITRQQMAAFLYRYAAFCGKDVSARRTWGPSRMLLRSLPTCWMPCSGRWPRGSSTARPAVSWTPMAAPPAPSLPLF